MMQGIFCLGIIWKMDPYEMPRGFCIAQTIVIASAAYIMAGVSSAFSGSLSLTVLSPRGWANVGEAVLQWRPIFSIPVIIFPTIATAVHVTLLVKLDAVQPTNDMHCDASHPEWVRFFGYAAMPFVMGIPCTILAILSLIDLQRTSQNVHRMQRAYGIGLISSSSGTAGRELTFKSWKPAFSRSETSDIDHHRPPSPPGVQSKFCFLFSCRTDQIQRPPPPVSPTRNKYTPSVSMAMPTLKVPPVDVRPIQGLSGGVNEESDRASDSVLPLRVHDPHELDDESQGYNAKANFKGIERELSDRRRGLDLRPSTVNFEADIEKPIEIQYGSGSNHQRQTSQTCRWAPRKLTSAFWRIIIFQVFFSVVQVLACLSTILDVARRRPRPTPFGLQHIALLLSAWGPAVVFGHLPAVRRNLLFRCVR
ncbi:hypothetical protein APHAL10511_006979 [Amanita phalloides]|nr:hypothetical protein APHAL10511_006979 [Amanita phalloides]